MKLLVKMVDLEHRGKQLMLCDENGDPLPRQAHINVNTSGDMADEVTVRFIIDGDLVKFA